ncbi:MAG: helix-turn-helix transcriptional regulator [Blastocatellia bacterium]|nr:helix-turn-helix transcriptional regulator [Blastocatellia bacterium]
MSENAIADYIAQNIRQLKLMRNLTQEQLVRISGVPKLTWNNLESGTANPTVSVLAKVAEALQVSVEELISPPKPQAKPHDGKDRERNGRVIIRRILPDQLLGLEIDRMELPPGTELTGSPHRYGTMEYLVCESGRIQLEVYEAKYELDPGDVVVFHGDQSHIYANRETDPAVAYSAIVVGPSKINTPDMN